jgi:hypothetical protein
MSKRVRTFSVMVTAALALAGGIAYAGTTSGSTTDAIGACAKTDSGLLRIDTGTGCLPSEQSLELGKPTHADERYFFASLPDTGNWRQITTGTWPGVRPSMTHIVTTHLGSGAYTVTAEVLGKNYSGVGILVCLLGNPTAGYTVAQAAVGNAAGYAIQQTIEEQAIFSLPQGGDLELSCFNAPQGDSDRGQPAVGFASVIATGVATFTSTQEP